MATTENKKVLIGVIGVAVVLVLLVLIGVSVTGDDGAQAAPPPNRQVSGQPGTSLDGASADAPSRSAPSGSSASRERLAGAPEGISDGEEATDETTVQKKNKRSTKRCKSRKKRAGEIEEEEVKGTGKGEVINKPI